MTTHAYRASAEFAAAIRAKAVEVDRFRDEVVVPFDEAHPNTKSLWVRRPFSATRECIGFTDPETEKPPAGLVRAKSRQELRPRKGSKAGAEWQDHLDALNAGPSLSDAFREFKVPESVLGNGVLWTVGMFHDGDDTYLHLGGPLTHGRRGETPEDIEHVTPIPLSEFYAIRERLGLPEDTREAA